MSLIYIRKNNNYKIIIPPYNNFNEYLHKAKEHNNQNEGIHIIIKKIFYQVIKYQMNQKQ